MRGDRPGQGATFSYVSLEERIPQDHPIRSIRRLTEAVLADLSPRFDALYSSLGRPSIPPEEILRALLLQVLFSVRSERQLMEQINYNLMFRWFVGLQMDDRVWVPTVFSKNRDRLLAGEIAQEFLRAVVEQARKRRLLSDEHFTVDGTLIEAWAGQKSFRKKDGSPPSDPQGNFHGEKRSNDTHASTTDPDAKLMRRTNHGEAKLCYHGHILIENRNSLVVDGCLTQATGFAERDAATEMLARRPGNRRLTLGADKGYDAREFVGALRQLRVTPHVTQNTSNRRSAIDGRTTRHASYQISQSVRCRIERVNGWLKTVAGQRKTKYRGKERVGWAFTFALAVYNLIRIRNLEAAT